jgi:hypothetical protein
MDGRTDGRRTLSGDNSSPDPWWANNNDIGMFNLNNIYLENNLIIQYIKHSKYRQKQAIIALINLSSFSGGRSRSTRREPTVCLFLTYS